MGELTVSARRYIEADRESARKYQRQGRAEATKKNDRRVWHRFSNYLGAKDPWRATSEEVAAWCARLADDGLSLSYIHGALSVLNYKYGFAGKGEEFGRFGTGIRQDNPVKSPLVRSTMRGIRSSHTRSVRKVTPVSLETLEKLLDLQPPNETGLRNKAILALAWGGACHGFEIANMDIGRARKTSAYVEIEDEGLKVTVRRKISTRGSYGWQVIGIPKRKSSPQYCPKRLLIAWLETYAADRGMLFPAMRLNRIIPDQRINTHSLIKIMRPSLEKLGLPPDRYASRSLRSGCVTWLLQEGVPMGRAMQHCGYRRPESILEQIQSVSAILLSPLSETVWCK